MTAQQLQLEGFRIIAYFYNPNIHPWKERERRLQSLNEYTESKGIDLLIDEEYPLEENISMLLNAANRCDACFEDRLTSTALKAAEMGIENFSTTLSISPYQNQSSIRSAGEKAEQKSATRFIFRDFREFYRDSVRISREGGMYRQSYCGCVFSERDRYRPKT